MTAKERESCRLVKRKAAKDAETICPDCGRLRTNLKRHRGSKLCKKKRENALQT